MDTKGFQLSINFMVMLILSLVLFGLGLFLLNSIISTGEDLNTQVGERIEQQLNAMMDDGSLVVVSPQRTNTKRGDYARFNMAFWNNLQSPTTFSITVVDDDGWASDVKWINSHTDVQPGAKVYTVIAAKVPPDIPSGQYSLTIEITGPGTDQYGSKKRVYVTV